MEEDPRRLKKLKEPGSRNRKTEIHSLSPVLTDYTVLLGKSLYLSLRFLTCKN